MTALVVDPALCELCYRCVEVCPTQAIRVAAGEPMNAQQAGGEVGEPPSFRDRAAAAIRGLADASIQPSSAKRRAEYMAKVVLDLTPNLVIMVDRELHIVAMSPSAERAFGCSVGAVRNRPLRDILCPTEDFSHARDEKRTIIKSRVRYRPDLIVEQTVVPALEDDMIVAIMRDITAEERRREELAQIARETIQRTQEVINFQMQVAHEIASLLGETTAESKTQLGRLIQLVKGLEGIEV